MKAIAGIIAAMAALFLLSGCDESSFECGVGQKALNGECVAKTCQTDGYQCPDCDTAIGETLGYFADESGFCKVTWCPDAQGNPDENYKWVDHNETFAECVAKTCQTDSYQCPECNEAIGETLGYFADESGYCKVTWCPDANGNPDEDYKWIDHNETFAECIAKTCRDDSYGCPSCASYEKLTYNSDGSGTCIAKNCRDDGYNCPSCDAYEQIVYNTDGTAYCTSKPCAYPAIGSRYSLSNLVIPMCKVQLKNGQTLRVDLGIGSGASTLSGKSNFVTGNGLSLNCGDVSGVCPGIAAIDDKIMPLRESDFTPAVLEFELNEAMNRATLTKITKIKDSSNHVISALFHPLMESNSSKHAYDRNGNEITYNANAIDTEAVVRLSADRGYWVGDAYTASIAHLNENGVITKRFVPQGWMFTTNYDVNDSLPAALVSRAPYGGIEAIAVDEINQLLYFMTAAPFSTDSNTNLRLYTVSLNAALDDLALPVNISNDHNYTLASAGHRVSEMYLSSPGTLLVVEHDGTNTQLYRVPISGAILTKNAVTISGTTPPNVQAFAPAPMSGSSRFFFANDNNFGQNGSANQMLFVDLNTTGF